MSTSNDKWTFGIINYNTIITNEGQIDTKNTPFIGDVIQSILDLNIPKEKFEIIIVGGNNYKTDFISDNIKLVYFNESIRSAWITKKKNIIFELAQYENIIVNHDYIMFEKDWYEGYLSFDTEWDVSMCKIKNYDGTRWRDWILLWNQTAPYTITENGITLAPNRLKYDDTSFVNTIRYISGATIIGKKKYLLKNKLDERFCWGECEDGEWSGRCRSNWIYKMNTNSTLKLLKQYKNAETI